MDDEPTTPDTAANSRVSFDKGSGGSSPASTRSGSGLGVLRGKPTLTVDGSPMPPPPKQVRNAALALLVSGLAALIASLSLFGEKHWLLTQAIASNKKLKTPKPRSTLPHAVDSTVTSSLVMTMVLLVALAFAARGVIRGRHWARWTVIGLWVLATFTGTFAGFNYVLGIASSEPLAFKVPSFVAAVALIVAVVFVSVKPSAQYFGLTRPPRPGAAAGAPPRRGGLFGPRPATPAAAAPVRNARETTDRSRAKQRASTESVAKGAELARARAKASKSRRSGA